MLNDANIICEAGLAMHKYGKQYFASYIKQKSCCPFRTKKDDSLCACKHPKYFNCKKTVAVPDIFQLIPILELL